MALVVRAVLRLGHERAAGRRDFPPPRGRGAAPGLGALVGAGSGASLVSGRGAAPPEKAGALVIRGPAPRRLPTCRTKDPSRRTVSAPQRPADFLGQITRST